MNKVKITLFILISISILSFKSNNNVNSGLIKYEFNLKDGDEIIINQNKFIIDDIKLRRTLPQIESALLKSFEDEYMSIKDICNVIDSQHYGYWYFIPKSFETYFDYFDRSSKFELWDKKFNSDRKGFGIRIPPDFFEVLIHKLFRNKTARTYLVNYAINYIINLCEIYPIDFKENILKEINELIDFTNSLETIQTFEKDSNEFYNYWKGFIFRRYKTDNVQIAEIKNSL